MRPLLRRALAAGALAGLFMAFRLAGGQLYRPLVAPAFIPGLVPAFLLLGLADALGGPLVAGDEGPLLLATTGFALSFAIWWATAFMVLTRRHRRRNRP